MLIMIRAPMPVMIRKALYLRPLCRRRRRKSDS
jgi:hypothetical protein